MAAPLLAQSFGELPFAVISAIAFTTVLGTVSGLIMAASGAVAHDLMANFLRMEMDDHAKVRAGKIAAVVVGVIAMVLGMLFKRLQRHASWSAGRSTSPPRPTCRRWSCCSSGSGTTKQGITAAILVGMVVLARLDPAERAGVSTTSTACPPRTPLVPFSQPGIVTIPLGFVVLVVGLAADAPAGRPRTRSAVVALTAPRVRTARSARVRPTAAASACDRAHTSRPANP